MKISIKDFFSKCDEMRRKLVPFKSILKDTNGITILSWQDFDLILIWR